MEVTPVISFGSQCGLELMRWLKYRDVAKVWVDKASTGGVVVWRWSLPGYRTEGFGYDLALR